jgi:hypothetical protein
MVLSLKYILIQLETLRILPDFGSKLTLSNKTQSAIANNGCRSLQICTNNLDYVSINKV